MSFFTGFNISGAFRRSLPVTILAFALLASILATALPLFGQDVRPAFDVPRHSRGIAWAWDKVWVGGIGERGNWIHAYNPFSGELVDSLRAPVPDCLSLEGHGDALVYMSIRSDSTYFITPEGVRAVATPRSHLAGLGSDGDYLWYATYSDPTATLIKMDNDGNITHAVPYGGRNTRDMAFLRDRLYIADQLTQNVRVVEPQTGRLIRNIPSPGLNPSGVASDGFGLWLLDEGDGKSEDRIYRVAVRPEGGIRYSALEHNYGSVVINDSRDMVFWIFNDGPRETRIIDFEAREGNDDIFIPHVWNFPETIQAGDSVAFRVSFNPAYADSAHILFAITYDLDRVENIINVRGKGVRRQRDILIRNEDRNLEFGMVYQGIGIRNSNMLHLVIESNGGDPLTITALRITNASFTVGGVNFPFVMREPGVYRLPVFFRPNVNGEIRGQLTIVSDDPDAPEIIINLHGRGELYHPQGGTPLWNVEVGDQQLAVPRIRALQPIDDVTRDGLADIVIASNDYKLSAFHAASTTTATPFWTYRSDVNPWRSGRVTGPKALGEGGDWDRDGIRDIVFGLDGGAMNIVAISGATGRELWIVDTHGLRGYGGIPQIVRGLTDFTADNVNDVYVATVAVNQEHSTNALFLIDGRTAEVRWMVNFDNEPFDITLMNDLTGDEIPDLVATLTNGDIIGVDGSGGNRIYEDHVEGEIKVAVPFEDINGDGSSDVCIVTYNHGLVMLNGSNGSIIWHNRNAQEVSLAINNGDLNRNDTPDLIFGTIHATFFALDGATGQPAWDGRIQVGSDGASLAHMEDFSGDGRDDYLVGTQEGRLYAMSGNGRDALWSYSDVHEGHAFFITMATRDVDGNGRTDVFSAMENGTVYCFAGSFAGNNAVVESDALLPASLLVSPAYPNPFNSTVTIPFVLNRSGLVGLKIFDVSGREIYRQDPTLLPVGSHRLIWDGADFSGKSAASGLYFVSLSAGSVETIKQVHLLR